MEKTWRFPAFLAQPLDSPWIRKTWRYPPRRPRFKNGGRRVSGNDTTAQAAVEAALSRGSPAMVGYHSWIGWLSCRGVGLCFWTCRGVDLIFKRLKETSDLSKRCVLGPVFGPRKCIKGTRQSNHTWIIVRSNTRMAHVCKESRYKCPTTHWHQNNDSSAIIAMWVSKA